MGNQDIKYFEKLINYVKHQNADEIFALATSKKHGYDIENETLFSTDDFFIKITKISI